MTYVGDANKEDAGGCFFCRAWQEKGRERQHLLVARTDLCLIMLNRFPYASAHLMLAPARHVGDVEEATLDEGRELWRLAAVAKKVLRNTVRQQGFNIGINQGRSAGAGVLDHLHVHVVPRWTGDVNFMPVLADLKVIPQALEETWELLTPYFADWL